MKNEVIIHCSATDPDWMAGKSVDEKRDEIRRWHMEERGWRDIGYAVIIDRDGSTADGRDLNGDGEVFDDIGAHTKGRNTNSIGICLIGGRTSSANDAFEDNFTSSQANALRYVLEEIEEWAEDRGGKITRIAGHNEFAAKACPGFNVGRWLRRAPPAKTSMAQSKTGWAAIGSVASGLVAALVDLHPIVQGIAVVGIISAGAFIWWERRNKFKAGDR